MKKIPLHLKFYQITKFLYSATRSFPREYKYTLGGDIIDLSWSCLDLTLEANGLPNEDKHPKILMLSGKFDQLKMRLRIAQEMKLLSKGQFSHLYDQYMKEAGKMLGGWLVWAKKR